MGKLLAAASISSFRQFIPLLHRAIQRIFITANPVLETHFPLENTKTLTGDFRVGALCVLPTTATTVTLHGQLASASNYFKVLSTGFASISIGGSVVTSTVLATKDSKLRTYDVELSGNDFLFQENGVTIDTVTDAGAAANSLVIDVLCQSNGADFFDGTYADPKITDLTTPSNSESWEINRATGNTEQSSSGNNILTYNNAPDSTRELFTFIDGRWVGQNIVVNGSFDDGVAVWSLGFSASYTVTNGVAEVTGGVQFGIFQPLTLIVGSIYEAVSSIKAGTAANSRLRIFDTNGLSGNSVDSELVTNTSEFETVNILYTATTIDAAFYLRVSGSGVTGFYDNNTFKRIIEVA